MPYFTAMGTDKSCTDKLLLVPPRTKAAYFKRLYLIKIQKDREKKITIKLFKNSPEIKAETVVFADRNEKNPISHACRIHNCIIEGCTI